MKRTVRNYIIRIGIICVLAAAVILIAHSLRPSWAESTEQRADQEITQKNDLLLWYYDEALTPYVEQLKTDYFRQEGLRVGSELVSVVSFFDSMNQKNVSGEGAPDLYITDTTMLEQAFLGSLAKPNAFPDIYSLQNYSVKALTSVMYKGKQVAYPLCFDMEYFVYNQSYMSEAPKSFAQISDQAAAFKKDAESSVDMVILYDAANLMYNYQFIGGCIDLGGTAGDDDTAITLDKDKAISALKTFKDFKESVKININTNTYDLTENSFIYGRSMASILKCSSLAALNREKTPYSVCDMPAVSDEVESKALSSTWCVCVNPMAADTAAAEKLAKFMTYDLTSSIYSLTGFMSCRRMEYSEPGFAEVYALYDKTASMPKFIETETLWRDMKKMFQTVWTGGKVKDAYETFETALKLQLSTRTEQEK